MSKIQTCISASLFLIFSMGFSISSSAQITDTIVSTFESIKEQLLYRNNDSNYIENYGNQIAGKIVAVSKLNYLRFRDNDTQSTLRYRPSRKLSLGLGVAHKFFAFDLTLQTDIGEAQTLENTRSFDFQVRLYTSKHLLSTTLQYYKGYMLAGNTGISSSMEPSFTDREDLRTINFNLQYMYAFNYTRFSMKAPFVFNERQKRSAGSVVFGAQFGILNMESDSSLIPVEWISDFNRNMNLTSLNVINVGAGIGYMHTFIIEKNFFATLSLIPGLVFNYGDYSLDNISELPTGVNLSLRSMNSIGYNGNRFFAGASFIWDTFYTSIDTRQRAEMGSGKMNAFVGYRFGDR